MAAVASTQIGSRLPIGDRVLVTRRTDAVVTAGGAAEESIDFGLSGVAEIERVISLVAIGAVPGTGVNAVLNGTGSGDTPGDVPGELGVESVAAAVLEATVIGKL